MSLLCQDDVNPSLGNRPTLFKGKFWRIGFLELGFEYAASLPSFGIGVRPLYDSPRTHLYLTQAAPASRDTQVSAHYLDKTLTP